MGPLEGSDLIRLSQKQIVPREGWLMPPLASTKTNNSDETWEDAGIHRTISQIKTCWKSLKASYYKAKQTKKKNMKDIPILPVL